MIDLAFAQTGPAPGGLGGLISFAPLILVFVVFYFLLIRPQQKKAKGHQQMLGQLKKNDEVMTSGGIYGKVINLTDAVVTLEVASNVRIRVHRPQISQVVTGEKPAAKEGKEQ
jgi:preprotein translocase subunit YajC